ncbi:MAG: hypothetical protein WBF87_04015 [Mesorhizobium sp.]
MLAAGFAGSANASSFATIAPPSSSPSIIHLGTPAKEVDAQPVAALPAADAMPAAASSVVGGMVLTPLVYVEETPPELARRAVPSGTIISASIIALGEPGVEDMKVAAVPKRAPHHAIPFVIRAGLWGDTSAEPMPVAATREPASQSAKASDTPANPAAPTPTPSPAPAPAQAPAQSRPEPAPNLTRIR